MSRTIRRSGFCESPNGKKYARVQTVKRVLVCNKCGICEVQLRQRMRSQVQLGYKGKNGGRKI